jgi:hypothetical protein
MKYFCVVAVFFVATLCGFGGSTAYSKEANRPSDYFMEQWLAGTVGGLMTGPAMERLTIYLYCGPEEENPSPEKALCQGVGTIYFRYAFYMIGIPIGVSTAVLLDGLVHDIDGSIGATINMSLAGALSGVLVSLLLERMAELFFEKTGLESLRPWILPVNTLITVFWPPMLSSLMATLAFQSGARMKPREKLQLNWTVPLFQVRF